MFLVFALHLDLFIILYRFSIIGLSLFFFQVYNHMLFISIQEIPHRLSPDSWRDLVNVRFLVRLQSICQLLWYLYSAPDKNFLCNVCLSEAVAFPCHFKTNLSLFEQSPSMSLLYRGFLAHLSVQILPILFQFRSTYHSRFKNSVNSYIWSIWLFIFDLPFKPSYTDSFEISILLSFWASDNRRCTAWFINVYSPRLQFV